MVEGEPWYQVDHALFLTKNVPALAVTSVLLAELTAQITHTPRHTPEIADPTKLVTLARALHALVLDMDRQSN